MVDPSKFLDSLFKYDKDNISDEIIKKIQPYIDDDAFQPAAISKVCLFYINEYSVLYYYAENAMEFECNLDEFL